MKKFFVVSALLLCLILSACGESSEVKSSSAPSETPTSENPTENTGDIAETTDTGTVTEIVTETADASIPGMRDITTMELVREMGVGINLGNTFESCGDWIKQWGDGTVASYETAWGSPIITKEMIDGYAEAGFGVLRVPVAWSNLADDEYNLSQDYIEAVREVVEWALDDGMYVIINIHHDNGWMANFPNDYEGCIARYEKIWTQVAAAFADYDDHLMFESLNEEAAWDAIWTPWKGTQEDKEFVFDLCNRINQKFVDVVRASGEKNAVRHLLIAGYATGIDHVCCDLYKMPEDPANRCAVSIHYYTPSTFAILTEDASWGKNHETWGTEKEIQELNSQIQLLVDNYISKGIPVIMGEYGCPLKNKDMDSVYLYLTTVCKTAYDAQICPILWDTPGNIYDRLNARMNYPDLQEAYHAILAGEEVPEGHMTPMESEEN